MKNYIVIIFCSLFFVNPAFSVDTPANTATDTTANASAVTPASATPNTTISANTAETGYSGSELGQPPAQGVAIIPQGIVKQIPLQPEPVLKRIDINRIGSAPSYETFDGLRFGKYFTIAQSVEIYQQPKPIDAYVMDAKKIPFLMWNYPWKDKSDYRSQIQPIFTRAYSTQITMSDPKNKEGQWRYTHDHRDIYQNQFPIYQENPQTFPPPNHNIPYTINTNYKHEEWDQNEILWMHAKKIPGIEWTETLNFGYRYSTMNAKNDGSTDAYYEVRQTYFSYFSLAPSDRCEFFGQFEYFKSHRPKSDFTYNPDHYLYAGEIRMKTADLKTSVIPRVSWSEDLYYPFKNTFQKYEYSIRIGHDFTPKLNATDTVMYNMAFDDEPDNTAHLYDPSIHNPIHTFSGWVGNQIRTQYNFYDRLWAQSGLDYAAGTNVHYFDNVGFLAGLEYYSPGLIRIDVGYQGNDYYNLSKDGDLGKWLSSIYFKCYFFM